MCERQLWELRLQRDALLAALVIVVLAVVV
jgi:hypothetical protein